MFDIGFWELTIIGVVALVIVGPERLPGLARTAGLWVGKGRRMLADVKRDIDREIKSSEVADLSSLKKDFEEAGKEVEKVGKEIKTESGVDDLKSTFKDASPIKEDLKDELDEIDKVSKEFDSELSGNSDSQTEATADDAVSAVDTTPEPAAAKKVKQTEGDAA